MGSYPNPFSPRFSAMIIPLAIPSNNFSFPSMINEFGLSLKEFFSEILENL